MNTFEQLQSSLNDTPKIAGIDLNNMEHLPDSFRLAVKELIHQRGVTLAELADIFHIEQREAHILSDALVDKGFIKLGKRRKENVNNEPIYRANLARAHGNKQFFGMWDNLIDDFEE